MSTYNTKNYTEQGGDVTHIGGKLIIEEGATVDDRTDAEDMPECLVRHESGFVEGGFGDG